MQEKMLKKLYVGKVGIPTNGNFVGQDRKVFYRNKRNHYIDIDTGLIYPILSETPTLPKYGIISLVPLTTYVKYLSRSEGETKLNGTRQKKIKLTWRVK